MKKNWRTTVFGLATAIGALCSALQLMFDGNSLTNPDWAATSAAVTAGIGLIFSKDHKVTGGTVKQ